MGSFGPSLATKNRTGYSQAIAENNGFNEPVHQIPIAVVGMACRLPGHCNTPQALWEFMMRGGIAANEPPGNRFNLGGHYDGSAKPFTMKTPGAMFMEDVDPADFDAQFFNINHSEACSMDPQQRVLMEVAYECLENAGIPIESIRGRKIGCIIGASAVDYHDMDCRDPDDRTDSPTLGSGRALLSNRISHFLNIHGPSISLDTACSSTLTALNVACLYLGSNLADGMLVGGANLYLSPERNQDMGAMRMTASTSGRCHAFDSKADGYVAAEAVNVIYLKRVDHAIRDKDPIRALIRGTAVNSAGKTPGIAMPNSHAQAMAIKDAYHNARITNLADTGYLECHGTGTLAGDPVEVQGIASVFSNERPTDKPLLIGSVKGNIGHSEAAAGLSSLIKVVLAIEKGSIPGTATFLTPNPNIDFTASGVKAFRGSKPWPAYAKRRASVNSFGFGGSNAHVVVESPEYLLGNPVTTYKSSYLQSEDLTADFFTPGKEQFGSRNKSGTLPRLLILSANDENSLFAASRALSSHVLNPAIKITMDDLAYTLSERRSRLYHRAYCIQNDEKMDANSFVVGRKFPEQVRVGLIFTGQGAQWPLMGRGLVEHFPVARNMVQRLDEVLRTLSQPPPWTLLSVLISEQDVDAIRNPEVSQPIVTALQLAYLEVLSTWGIQAVVVAGHSSGEIAAAVAAGLITIEEAIKIAFFRGKATAKSATHEQLGMLAIGLNEDLLQQYLDPNDDIVQIACFNSPISLTVSGPVAALERLRLRVVADKHFARLLNVNQAYHSVYMREAGDEYAELLQWFVSSSKPSNGVTMISSVTGKAIQTPISRSYWVQNMVSQVLFRQAIERMDDGDNRPNFYIEVGPSNSLRGPLEQTWAASLFSKAQPLYSCVCAKAQKSILQLYKMAGELFIAGGPINISSVNEYETTSPAIIIDLPNYKWNRGKKYWHESAASRDWRSRSFMRHDLLGTKILGTSWHNPVWKNHLRLSHIPWLQDHRLGKDIIFPGAGYISMAIEAIFQMSFSTAWAGKPPASFSYRLRDIKFLRAMVLDDEGHPPDLRLGLTPSHGSDKPWHQFTITTTTENIHTTHATGLICIDNGHTAKKAREAVLRPFESPRSPKIWYERMRDVGFNFGPTFQKLVSMEYSIGLQTGRAVVSLKVPASKWPQSAYILHPASIDGCFQSVMSSIWRGDSSRIDVALVPSQIDSLVIPFYSCQPDQAVSIASSDFLKVGRQELVRNHASSCKVYDASNGNLLLDMMGLQYNELPVIDGKGSSMAYCQLLWDIDIASLTKATLTRVTEEAVSTKTSAVVEKQPWTAAQRLIDLVAFKNPRLSLLEMNLDEDDSSSLWLENDGCNFPLRKTFSHHQLVLSSAEMIMEAKKRFANTSGVDFMLSDFTLEHEPPTKKYDLVIVKLSQNLVHKLTEVVRQMQSNLLPGGLGLIYDRRKTLGVENELSILSKDYITCTFSSAFTSWVAQNPPVLSSQDIVVVPLTDSDTGYLVDALGALSWNIVCCETPTDIEPGSNVLITDELHCSVLGNISRHQWETLKLLLQKGCNILWVTEGAQMRVKKPSRALVNGLFRTLRNEYPTLKLLSLDVEQSSSSSTIMAINSCLISLVSPKTQRIDDSEFVERDGLLHISRIIPDARLNTARFEESTGRPLVPLNMQSSNSLIRLRAERVGRLDSLNYCEVAEEISSLQEGQVEIQIVASGVNFKDVATVVGIVPENEYLLGGEGSGIITRVGSGVATIRKGQRVAFFKKGSFANKIQAPYQVVHAIPDSMSFNEAATVPCVFMTAIYSLFHLAHVYRGARVLIHSAAGGVGIAAIQLCLYAGAEIYATVGTPEKREFLRSSFGIPDERIYSSRTGDFARQIMEQTGGKGVDIILNSLSGSLLDESWRIIADGGVMVEIGKKDILDRSSLAMEPFGRNASFHALDLSHEQIDDDLVASLLSQAFSLLDAGHITPILPIQAFSFSEAAAALRLMRTGKHIGKLVLSNKDISEEVMVRPMPRSMRSPAGSSYLIVGGLRGICGSLAVYLAKCGAESLIFMSRSSSGKDIESLRVLRDLAMLGCDVETIDGDVTLEEDLRKVLKCRTIRGIVQGSMILKDRTFSGMSEIEYQDALSCKVQGSWNLHNMAIELRQDLDFFIMLSSISGIHGNKGQANYASANSFLDAFASYRRSLGLPACSLVLGVVSDLGFMSARHDLIERFDSAVWNRIGERELQKAFDFSIQQQHPATVINSASADIMITGIKIPQPQDSALLMDARFLGLSKRDGRAFQAADSAGSSTLAALQLLADSPSKTKAMINTVLQSLNNYLMKSLRHSDPLETARPLSDYGMDSLAAIEFLNFVKSEFMVELTTIEVINARSLISLSKDIIKYTSSD